RAARPLAASSVAPIALAIDPLCVLPRERPSRPGDEHRWSPTLLAHRQDELEAAALAGRGLQLDLAAERCRELTGDREPEAGALAVARPERPEDPLLLLGGDARPIVLDRNADRPVYLRERDSDPPAVRRPAKRVREQVRDD